MRRIAAYGGLLAALFVVYGPAIRGSFLVDDLQYLAQNPLIRNSPSPWHFWYWTRQADYWPVFYTLMWTLWRLFGEWTTGYHVLNVLVHFANACLVGTLCEAYGLRRNKGWAMALFALHPLTVPSVAWIFQLKTLLSTMFVLLSWLSYLRSLKNRETGSNAYLAAVAWFALAAFTKTSVVVFPVTLLLGVWILDRRSWKELRPLEPFFAASLVAGTMTLIVNTKTFIGRTLWNPPPLERALVSARNAFFYLGKVLWPWPVRFVYPWSSAPAAAADSWVAPLAWIALALVAALALRRSAWTKELKLAVFFGLFCLLNLVPALGFVSVPYMRYSLVSDVYAYLSLVGFTLLLALAAQRVPERRAWLLGPGLLVLAAYDFNVSAHYANSEQLWEWAAEGAPRSVWAHFNLGVTKAEAGKFGEATAPLEQAAYGAADAPPELVLEHRAPAQFLLARVLMETGDARRAAQTLERLLAANPQFPNAAYNLAMIYHQKLGELDLAEKYYLRALNPPSPETEAPARFNLCHIARLKGDVKAQRERCR